MYALRMSVINKEANLLTCLEHNFRDSARYDFVVLKVVYILVVYIFVRVVCLYICECDSEHVKAI